MFERRTLGELFRASDKTLFVVLAALFSAGLLSIYSAGNGASGNGFHYALRQLTWGAVALAAALAVWKLDMPALLHYSYVIYAAGCFLLVAVLFVGSRTKGSQAWFGFSGVSIQPSEFVKIALALVLAQQCRLFCPDTFPRFLGALALAGVAGILVLVQPDLGSALVYGTITFFALVAAGAPGKYLGGLAGCVLAVLPGAWFFLKEYQRNRLLVFIEPALDPLGAGYNVIQSRIAVGSGRLLGKGFMHGTQSKLRFLPEPHTDFVFSVFAEEFGFVGSCLLLALYGVLLWRLTAVARRTRELENKIWIVALIGWLWFQFFEAIGMSMGLLPITGLPLPFMCYGGSSLVAAVLAVALVAKQGALDKLERLDLAVPDTVGLKLVDSLSGRSAGWGGPNRGISLR
ncbi:rod shape-determining protein RodA [Jonquetella anthropi]|uniref:rod shape-determining protein RodA n=1 Tax=Jonquetella anthropi TaxID=428712 RepID=UPI0001B912D5|nr:rod shape-determining protein RodA [Jonquetella anthropi]EEX47812.1 rod shape-determining protein RodA [Jonquetella anthropi E3_33 E1]